MQQLELRNTYTPRSASQAPGNCDLRLNSSVGVLDSVLNLKTISNNLDVNLLQPSGGFKTDMLACGGDKCPPL